MTLVMGVDPGKDGAIASVDSDTGRIVAMHDMPTWNQAIGQSKRKRINPVAVSEIFQLAKMLGVEMVVIEAVGGRPRQSAMNAFTFGYGVGLVFMACIAHQLPIESVPPASWKKLLNVPGKSKADDTAIMTRADEMFPDDRQLFRGPKGGNRVDRAEAAMLAKFGCRHLLHERGQSPDSEGRMLYNVDAGA